MASDQANDQIKQEWSRYVQLAKANMRARKEGREPRPLPKMSKACREERTEYMRVYRRRKRSGDL